MDLARGPAGVERPAHRRRREPVDGGAPARLDVGQQLQRAGQPGLQRARRHRGQVGLDQHVVDRAGQQLVEQRVGGPVVAGQQRAGVRRQAVEAGHAQRRRLLDRPADLLGAGARPPRAQPGDPGHQRRQPGAGGQHPPLGQLGEHVERHPPALHLPVRRELGGERVPGLARGVARPDERGQPGAVQPGPHHGAPALGHGPGDPGVEGVAGHPGEVAVGVHAGGEQPGLGGDLDHQRGHRLGDVQRPGASP